MTLDFNVGSNATVRSAFCLAILVAACPSSRAADPASPPPAETMDAIVVTSEKLTVESLIDRKVYSVAADAQSTFGSLSDILSVIPSVDVDPDGAISLRGDANVLVLIDGKPSTQFSGKSAGDALQSIPAKDIERIEVLTTPPAEFKADGAAGVINIITRKNRPRGTSGSLQGSSGTGGRRVFGAEGSYNSGGLKASVTAGYRQDFRQRFTQSRVLALDPTTSSFTRSRSDTYEKVRRDVPTVGASVGYAFNDRQSASASVSWDTRGGLRTYEQLDDISSASGTSTGSSRRQSTGRDPQSDYDAKLGFSQKLSGSGETLDFSLHRSRSNQREHYDYISDSFVPPSPTSYSNLAFHEEHGTTEFGADYVLPVAKSRSLKLGYAFEQDDFRFGNIGNTVDASTGIQTVNPNLTNNFKFRQQINAWYGSYQVSAGDWTWLGGLRAELTDTNAQQLTDNVTTATRYFKVYPSLHLDRSLSDQSTLSLGASKRVTRPDPDNLNPYIDHEYSPNLRAGNAHLQPQYTRSYELGYDFEGHTLSYGLTGYYRQNRDSATEVTEYLGNGISLTTKTNLPKNDSAGLEFTAHGRIVTKLTYSVSGNLFHSQIDATALGLTGLQSTTGVNAKFKLDYRPTTDDSAQITVSRTDKRLTPQGYVSAINLVNLGFKHQLKTDLTAVATVSDVFNGQRFQRFTSTPLFTERFLRTVRGRVVYLGFVYSFGIAKKEKQQNFEYDQAN